MTPRSAQDGQGRAPLLSLENVTKSFDATQALRGVSLTIGAGEFVGLVGPNGAGKSTLIKILDGVYAPDGGTITAGRIGVVHQDLGLIESLTVTENLRLGQPPLCSVPPLLSASRERDFCREALRAVGLREDLAHRSVERLSLGERTLVAIARTLARGAELIVVDEATSTLPPRESGWLIDTLKARKLAGAAVLMVSHKLAEILGCADRCVVLVDGQVTADEPIERVDLATLTRLMSRGSHQEAGPERVRRVPAGPPLLSLAGASTALAGPFTLDVHAGEIVGVTGLVGSGLYELALLASGRARPAIGSVRTAPGVRVGLLPPDRSAQANFPAESVAWNLTIGGLRRWRTRAGTLNHSAELGAARALAGELDVSPPNVSARMAALSGGNQQKVLIGRMLLAQSSAQAGCVVLCEPTRGVDVGARADIYRLIRQLAARGIGVLIVSSDTEDLLTLADRVGVVENQSCQRTWRPDELSTEQMASLL
jgi:ribose transport system ATP-binding protein